MYVLFLSAQTKNLSNNIPKEQKPSRRPINSNVRDALAFDITNKQKALMFVLCFCDFVKYTKFSEIKKKSRDVKILERIAKLVQIYRVLRGLVLQSSIVGGLMIKNQL